MADSDLTRRVEEIADWALEYDTGPDREKCISEACGNDETLRKRVKVYIDRAESLVLQPVIQPKPVYGEGRRIGPWKLLRRLDEGGFGIVYVAERTDGQVRQTAAIKFLKGTVQSRDMELRFLDERQILAHLNHPYIVGLIDAGITPEGQPYMVMELVEGALPIDAYVRLRKLSVRNCLLLFRKVCEAVAYAHHKLVIHRDLKPANILVADDGTPRLLDFGVAKILDPVHRSGASIAESTAILIGTERYWSPEQARGEPVDTATDIYSLGVILYELLAGVDPYDLDNRLRKSMAEVICNVDPRPPSEAAGRSGAQAGGARHPERMLKGDLDAILLQALRKPREERYGSVEEFSDDLERHLDHFPVRAHLNTFTYRISRFVRRNRQGVVAASLVTATLIGGLATTLYQRRQAVRNEHMATARELAAYASQFPADPQRALQLSIYAVEATSRYGEPAVPAAEVALHQAVWKSHASRTLNARAPGGVVLSADGRRLAALDGSTVTLWDVPSGKHAFALSAGQGNVLSAAFSADGSRLATCREGQSVTIWDTATGRALSSLFAGIEPNCSSISFSPDGAVLGIVKRGTVQMWDVAAGRRMLLLAARDHGVVKIPSPYDLDMEPPSWVDSGAVIALGWDTSDAARREHKRRAWIDVEGGTISEWDIDNQSQFFSIDIPALGGPFDDARRGLRAIFSSDGNLLAVIGARTLIWRALYPETRGVGPALTTSTDRAFPRFDTAIASAILTHDGKRILISRDGGTVELWEAAEHVRLLLELPARKAALSADGTTLATTDNDRTVTLWDTGPEQELPLLPVANTARQGLAISSDGHRLLAISGAAVKGGPARLLDSVSGRALMTLGTGDSDSVGFSPDGKRAVTGRADGPAKLWDVATGRELLNVGNTDPGSPAQSYVCFSADGSRILTASGRATLWNGSATLWDAVTGRRLQTLHRAVDAAAFSPGHSTIALASEGRAVVVDAATLQQRRVLLGPRAFVNTVTFHPDGRQIAAGDMDGAVWIWDASNGHEVARLRAESSVSSVAFSPDGRFLAAAGRGDWHVWNLQTGEEVARSPTADRAFSIAFTPDGKRLLVVLDSIGIAAFTLDDAELLKLARERLTRPLPLSPDECRRYLHAATCPIP